MSDPKLILFQAGRAWGMPSASPFCVKLELFLRAAKIPFEAKPFNPMQAPKGKMPYVLLRGEMIADSQIIIERLKKEFGIDWDEGLTVAQKATGHSVRRMLEEATYFAVLWQRWCVDANWPVVKKEYFGFMPPVVRSLLPEFLRKKTRKTAWAQGTGRHTPAEIEAMFCQDLEAVASLFVGPYFFGPKLTSVDLTLFAMLNGFIHAPLPMVFGSRLRQHQPFLDYCRRINDLYFP